MNLLERWERMSSDRLNAARVAAFPAPMLHAIHDDTLVVGYSVWSHNGRDGEVEVNHVVPSTVDDPEPVSVSTRSILGAPGVTDALKMRAPSYLSAHHPDWRSSRADAVQRESLERFVREIPFENVELSVDGTPVRGRGFTVGPWRFWESIRDGYIWTVCGPARIAEAGFTTSLTPGA